VAHKLGATEILRKPFIQQTVLAVIARALRPDPT